MIEKGRHLEFLAKAKEAEDRAAKAQDPHARRTWKKIADSYRELAQRLAQ